MHDSFPHALELSKQGYNAFALIYRPGDAYEDLARAITYICDHADELGVKRDGYSLWGGSAGARMAATLGNSANLRSLTGRTDLPQASAVIMQYTGYTTVSQYDGATYACCGTSDGIASWHTMQSAPRLRPRHWHRSRRLAPRCRPLLAEPVRCNSHPLSKSQRRTIRGHLFPQRHTAKNNTKRYKHYSWQEIYQINDWYEKAIFKSIGFCKHDVNEKTDGIHSNSADDGLHGRK